MKLGYKKISVIVFSLVFFLIANFCLADFINTKTQAQIGNQAIQSAELGYDVGGGNLLSLAQTIINAFLSIIGVILLAYIVSAGYKWMTAHGEEEKVTQAKDTLKRAIVGAIIIVGAYAISSFVVSRLESGTLKDGGVSTFGSAKRLV